MAYFEVQSLVPSLALEIQSLALTLEPDRNLLRLFHYSSVVQDAGITFMFHGSTCGTLDLQSENAEENYYRHDMATLTNLGVIFADNFTPVFHPRPCTMTVPNFPLLLIPSSTLCGWFLVIILCGVKPYRMSCDVHVQCVSERLLQCGD